MSEVQMCQACHNAPGVKRLATRGGQLVCIDCHQDYLSGAWDEDAPDEPDDCEPEIEDWADPWSVRGNE